MSTAADRRFYASSRWRKVRLAVLTRDGGLCVKCRKFGRIEAAVEVDHIEPRTERPDLELVKSNCQSLCRKCHATKTAADLNPAPAFCIHGYRGTECPICNEEKER